MLQKRGERRLPQHAPESAVLCSPRDPVGHLGFLEYSYSSRRFILSNRRKTYALSKLKAFLIPNGPPASPGVVHILPYIPFVKLRRGNAIASHLYGTLGLRCIPP